MNKLKKCVLCVDPETPENRIFTCKNCDLSVHVFCYGISTENEKSEWMCSPCKSGVYEIALCELCLQSDGAMKKTSCGKWAHVVCALFTEGATFEDVNQMEPIEISKISQSKWNQVCSFCSKNVGCCPLCSKSKCPNRIHITCAQNNGCLKEVTNKKDDSIKFRAYCNEHKPVDSKRRLSGKFVQGLLIKKGNQELKQQKLKSLAANAAWIVNAANDLSSSNVFAITENESKGDDDCVDNQKVKKKKNKKDRSESSKEVDTKKKKKHRNEIDRSNDNLSISVTKNRKNEKKKTHDSERFESNICNETGDYVNICDQATEIREKENRQVDRGKHEI